MPVDDRVALAGILFVLKTGIGWEDLPRETGCSGMTCWRRLRDWQAAGVWDAANTSPRDDAVSLDEVAHLMAQYDADKSGSLTAARP